MLSTAPKPTSLVVALTPAASSKICPNGALAARSFGSAREGCRTNVIQDLRGRVRALMDDCFKRPAFFHAQHDDVLPDPDLWHGPIPGDVDDVARKSQMPVCLDDAGH
jgi:hypothetical protein